MSSKSSKRFFGLKSTDILLIVLIGLVVIAVAMGCLGSCKEGFLSQFGDQVTDPFLVDYANMPEFSDPARAMWNAPKKQVPLENATDQYKYIGLTGFTQRPDSLSGYA